MSDDNDDLGQSGEQDALLDRLRLIEDQPLDERAASFAHLHDELRSALERGDSHSARG